MENYFHQATDNLPYVNFDTETGVFEIIGKSYPQNAENFYAPIIKLVKEYCQSPKNQTSVTCKIEYFQTTSQRFLVEILHDFSKISAPNKIQINWGCTDDVLDDEDEIIFVGKDLENLLNFKFNFLRH